MSGKGYQSTNDIGPKYKIKRQHVFCHWMAPLSPMLHSRKLNSDQTFPLNIFESEIMLVLVYLSYNSGILSGIRVS